VAAGYAPGLTVGRRALLLDSEGFERFLEWQNRALEEGALHLLEAGERVEIGLAGILPKARVDSFALETVFKAVVIGYELMLLPFVMLARMLELPFGIVAILERDKHQLVLLTDRNLYVMRSGSGLRGRKSFYGSREILKKLPRAPKQVRLTEACRLEIDDSVYYLPALDRAAQRISERLALASAGSNFQSGRPAARIREN